MDTSELSRREALLEELIRRGDTSGAIRLLLELIAAHAKRGAFAKAETLRERLYDIDSMALTEIVGKSTSGYWLMPMRVAATRPKTMVAAMSIHAKTGFLTQVSVRFMAYLPVLETGLLTFTETPSLRASEPRMTIWSPGLRPSRTSTEPSSVLRPRERITSFAFPCTTM